MWIGRNQFKKNAGNTLYFHTQSDECDLATVIGLFKRSNHEQSLPVYQLWFSADYFKMFTLLPALEQWLVLIAYMSAFLAQGLLKITFKVGNNCLRKYLLEQPLSLLCSDVWKYMQLVKGLKTVLQAQR